MSDNKQSATPKFTDLAKLTKDQCDLQERCNDTLTEILQEKLLQRKRDNAQFQRYEEHKKKSNIQWMVLFIVGITALYLDVIKIDTGLLNLINTVFLE